MNLYIALDMNKRDWINRSIADIQRRHQAFKNWCNGRDGVEILHEYLSGVVTFSDLSTWNQDKTIINGGNITTGQIHNKARTTTYDLDNAWIRMGKDAGTRVDIDTGRIRWYWENNLTGVLSSRYGKSYIGDNSRYTFLGWFSTGDPSFDYSTGGATSEFVGIAIDQVDKVIHCNASKFEIPGRIECGSLSVNGREI